MTIFAVSLVEVLQGFGGWQTYLKDVVLTFYLRLTESRKFKTFRTIKQWADVHGIVIYYCASLAHL